MVKLHYIAELTDKSRELCLCQIELDIFFDNLGQIIYQAVWDAATVELTAWKEKQSCVSLLYQLKEKICTWKISPSNTVYIEKRRGP